MDTAGVVTAEPAAHPWFSDRIGISGA